MRLVQNLVLWWGQQAVWAFDLPVDGSAAVANQGFIALRKVLGTKESSMSREAARMRALQYHMSIRLGNEFFFVLSIFTPQQKYQTCSFF